MKKNSIIRNITAVALLMLFVLSNMPKQWLHDVFASHNDCKKSHSFEKSLQISKQGFNCDCDNLVVEVPFAAAKEFFIDLPVLNVQPVFTLIEDKNFPTVCHFFFQLRGPPAIA